VPYIRTGLSRGEKCLVLCEEIGGKQILAALRGSGVDIGSALARGSVLVTQGPAMRPENGGFDPGALVAFFRASARVAMAEKHTGLRLCVDMASTLGKDVPRERLVEYQGLLHAFLAEQDALCMCIHGMDDFPADILLDALRAHPAVIHEGKVARNLYFIPPTGESRRVDASQLLDQRLGYILEQQRRVTRLRRQATRLTRFRNITASLIANASVADLLNRIVEGVVSLGYRMCWIGMANPDGSIGPAASCGDREGYLRQISVRWDDSPLGNGPMGIAIRKRRLDIVRDTGRSQRFAPWREQAAAAGYLSVAAVPIREGADVIGALAVYAPGRDTFDREAIEELSAFVLQVSLVLQRAKDYNRLALSEKRFRDLFEQIPAACFTYDRQGTILHWNRHCQMLFGYTDEEALGKSVIDLVSPAGGEANIREVVSRVFDGESFLNLEWENRTARGDPRRIMSNVFPFGVKGDVVELGISVNVDITERLRLEKEREELVRNIAKAQKMEGIGVIAGGIAHEFNNILGAVIGYASLLQSKKNADDPDVATIGKIQISAERAADLTKKLIGFARRGKYQVRTFRFNELVAGTLPLLARYIHPSIEIRTHLDPSDSAVEGDEGQMQRSLLDLCFNAMDAMPRGGTLSIRTGVESLSAEEAARYHVKKAGDHVFLEVRDTGTGMTEEVRSRIFEPFFTTRSEDGHSGMGLPSVYGIVKNHDGGIHVESVPGEGSVFSIYLPAAAHVVSEAAHPPAAPSPGGTETILIVDDQPEIREVASALLSALGYRTITAEDGEAACRVYRERSHEIRLVLLDIIMPRMGGRETFRILRKLAPGLPILLSSGYTVEGLAQGILNEGANGFIQKPYSLSELAGMIRGILDAVRPGPADHAGTGA
ncbi:MAG: Signal transduction histidine kinase, nitrogen specific, NtrB, partial [Actinobacteria bacterium]|nr:Signal transduction histidine kinase, nitrogen specific, NtrB [Actinomycetota bacterium]